MQVDVVPDKKIPTQTHVNGKHELCLGPASRAGPELATVPTMDLTWPRPIFFLIWPFILIGTFLQG